MKKKVEEYKKEYEKLNADTKIVSRKVELNSKLLKEYFHLLEETEKYIESHFFEEEVIAKFSVGLWGKLKSIISM